MIEAMNKFTDHLIDLTYTSSAITLKCAPTERCAPYKPYAEAEQDGARYAVMMHYVAPALGFDLSEKPLRLKIHSEHVYQYQLGDVTVVENAADQTITVRGAALRKIWKKLGQCDVATEFKQKTGRFELARQALLDAGQVASLKAHAGLSLFASFIYKLSLSQEVSACPSQQKPLTPVLPVETVVPTSTGYVSFASHPQLNPVEDDHRKDQRIESDTRHHKISMSRQCYDTFENPQEGLATAFGQLNTQKSRFIETLQTEKARLQTEQKQLTKKLEQCTAELLKVGPVSWCVHKLYASTLVRMIKLKERKINALDQLRKRAENTHAHFGALIWGRGKGQAALKDVLNERFLLRLPGMKSKTYRHVVTSVKELKRVKQNSLLNRTCFFQPEEKACQARPQPVPSKRI